MFKKKKEILNYILYKYERIFHLKQKYLCRIRKRIIRIHRVFEFWTILLKSNNLLKILKVIDNQKNESLLA